jgi:hypothetical protein
MSIYFKNKGNLELVASSSVNDAKDTKCNSYSSLDTIKTYSNIYSLLASDEVYEDGAMVHIIEDGTYIYYGNTWEKIESIDSVKKGQGIIEAKCNSCGAPIHITSRYQIVKCEYCGSYYFVKE